MEEMSLQELVDAYFDEATPGLRNAIITQAIPLVKSIIGKINRPDTPLSQYEDLESAGIMGLLQALDSYDPGKKVQFNTFAYYRIRGNIIDYLRKIDQMPRVQRSNYGKAQQVMEELSQKLGRMPKDEEVANEMGLSLDDYHKMLMNVQQRSVLSLDQNKYDNGDNGEALSAHLEDTEVEQPDARLDRQSMEQKIKGHLKKLKERERLILALYYYEDLTLSEIAVVLGLTEARISQIVGKLLIQLKASLSKEMA